MHPSKMAQVSTYTKVILEEGDKLLHYLSNTTNVPYQAFLFLLGFVALVGVYFAFLWLLVITATQKTDGVALFNKLKKYPFGKRVFTSAVCRIAPYSGSISPYIEDATYTSAKVSVTSHRALWNPFRSIHLAALVNLAELTISLAVFSALTKSKRRGIPMQMSSDFVKKATGKVYAVCKDVNIPANVSEYESVATVHDASGALCCTVRIKFKVSDVPAKKTN